MGLRSWFERILENPKVEKTVDRLFHIIGKVSRNWLFLGSGFIIGASTGELLAITLSLPKTYAKYSILCFLFGVFYAIAIYIIVTEILSRK